MTREEKITWAGLAVWCAALLFSGGMVVQAILTKPDLDEARDLATACRTALDNAHAGEDRGVKDFESCIDTVVQASKVTDLCERRLRKCQEHL